MKAYFSSGVRSAMAQCCLWMATLILTCSAAQATNNPPPSEECGQQPVNICIMLDRTGSVSASERTNEATAAKNLIDKIDDLDNGTRVFIGRFGDGSNGGTEAEIRDANPSAGGFQTFTTNYTQAKAAVDSALSSGSSVGTNVEDAIYVCKKALLDNDNGDQNIIVLISDFDPNEPGDCDNSNCPGADTAALTMATTAKGFGIRIFSIGFDVTGENSTDETNRALGASIASGTSTDNHCSSSNCDTNGTNEIANENADGDDWFLSPTANDLNTAFDAIFEVLQCEDDGNPCTLEACNEQGLCGSSFIPDCKPCSEGCDDGNACNGTETCGQNDTCQAGTPLSCNDGSLCTSDSCDPSTGCVFSPKTCTDGMDCSVDSCDPSTGECSFDTGGCECQVDGDCNDGNSCTDNACVQGECVYTNDNSNTCDDGLYCNGTESCDAGQCKHGGDPCSGGGECADSCDEETNSCNDEAGVSCNDGDGNDCTTGSCNGSGECVSSNNNNECDDGNPCTLDDECSGGDCGGTSKVCDDGISCTPDSCNESTGLCEAPTEACECVTDADCNDNNECTTEFCNDNNECERSNNSNSCDDGLFCNGPDTCGEGSCSVHEGDPCGAGGECANACDEAADSCNDPMGTPCSDDGNACTDNACNGAGECVPTNNETGCDDGNPCTLDDTCSNGDCSPGTPKDCSSGKACAVDSCNEETGACESDLSACECQVDGDCNDGNACTTDTCDTGTNTCSNTVNQGAECDDGTLCTVGDQCDAEGVCGGEALSCDDGELCTIDSCNAELGCLHEDIEPCGRGGEEPTPTPTPTPPSTPPPGAPPGDDSGQGGEGPVGGPTGVGDQTMVVEGSGCSLNAGTSGGHDSWFYLLAAGLSLAGLFQVRTASRRRALPTSRSGRPRS